jgi:hypothetical protein
LTKHNKVIIIAVLVCTMALGGLTAAFATPLRDGLDHFTYLPIIMNQYSPPNVINVAELISFMQLAGEDCSGLYTITLAPGIYTLTEVNNGSNGLPVVSCDITINGNASTIKRGSSAPDLRIFEITLTGKLTLNDVTISDGRTNQKGGAIYNNGGTLEITNSTFSGNSAINYGGGDAGHGGAVANEGGQVNIINSTFSANQAYPAGGAIHNDTNGTMTVTNTAFINNIGGGWSGGIDNVSGSLIIVGSSFIGNQVSHRGSAISNREGGIVAITDSVLVANLGGGIYNAGIQASIHDSCIFSNTPSYEGDVIHNSNSAHELDATNNWWGEADGPSGVGSGSGDSVSTYISFIPFLSAPFPYCPTNAIVSGVSITASGVKINSSYYVSPNMPISLSATVNGANLLTHDVAWSIVSGGGSLADISGKSITFTAPSIKGVTTIRATASEDPNKYGEITIRTGVISVRAIRTEATVLIGGSVPLWAMAVVDSEQDYDPANLTWSVVSGDGSIGYTPGYYLYRTFLASDSVGISTVRASSVADPSKYVDIIINVNSSGPITCSNPPVISSGDLEFVVSGNWGSDMPAMGAGIIGNSDPLIGETQTLTIECAVTLPKLSPLTSVSVTLITDNGRRPAQPLQLISGTNLGGQWQGSYLIDDTHCTNYQIEINATNAKGTSTVTITLR